MLAGLRDRVREKREIEGEDIERAWKKKKGRATVLDVKTGHICARLARRGGDQRKSQEGSENKRARRGV